MSYKLKEGLETLKINIQSYVMKIRNMKYRKILGKMPYCKPQKKKKSLL